MARDIYIRKRSVLWLVPLSNSHLTLHLIFSPQPRRLAEDPPFPSQMGLTALYHLASLRSAILDRRSLVQLFLL